MCRFHYRFHRYIIIIILGSLNCSSPPRSIYFGGDWRYAPFFVRVVVQHRLLIYAYGRAHINTRSFIYISICDRMNVRLAESWSHRLPTWLKLNFKPSDSLQFYIYSIKKQSLVPSKVIGNQFAHKFLRIKYFYSAPFNQRTHPSLNWISTLVIDSVFSSAQPAVLNVLCAETNVQIEISSWAVTALIVFFSLGQNEKSQN